MKFTIIKQGRTTEKAYQLYLEDIVGPKWVPKSQCKITGDSVWINDWLVAEWNEVIESEPEEEVKEDYLKLIYEQLKRLGDILEN